VCISMLQVQIGSSISPAGRVCAAAMVAYVLCCLMWPHIRRYLYGPLEPTWWNSPLEILAAYYLIYCPCRYMWQACCAAWRCFAAAFSIAIHPVAVVRGQTWLEARPAVACS